MHGRAPLRSGSGRGESMSTPQRQLYIVLGCGLVAGYILGMVIMDTADVMFTTGAEHHFAEVRLDTSGSYTADESRQQAHAQHQEQQQQDQQRQALQTAAEAAEPKKPKTPGDTIHSLLTSNGSPYQNFQARVMYGTYKLVQQMPGGEKLTGFTRILHRMSDDGFTQEIPTFRAKPLHPECDTYCDFPVADRPNAVQQWVDAVVQDPSLLKGDWVFLLECDYVWMKPLQAPNAHTDAPGLQFHFDYIIPTWPGVTETLKRLMEAQHLDTRGNIPPSGPAPALLRFWELRKVTPVWEVMTKAIEDDAPAVKLLGWVREMYAWDVAIVAKGVRMLTQDPKESPLLVQPPHDTSLYNASICHYTWGAIYNDTKGEVFKWEKREYTRPEHALKVPHIPMPPQPFKPDTWHLQDKMPVTKELHETLTAMLGQMNKAIDTLPDLTGKVGQARR